MTDQSIRLLAALPVPESTWEPKEPQTKAEHHPRGILRNASGVYPVVITDSHGKTGTDCK